VNRKWLPWIALGAVVAVAIVVLVAQSRPSDSVRSRTERLEHQLACPECSGESVFDSNSVSASVIRDDIPRRIAAGQTDDQIRADYVARYGERILLTPANGGIGVLAWLIPTLALLLGVFGIAAALRRWSRTPRLPADAEDEAIVAAAREHRDADA